eukprot:998021-Amphidinium_carterae.1
MVDGDDEPKRRNKARMLEFVGDCGSPTSDHQALCLPAGSAWGAPKGPAALVRTTKTHDAFISNVPQRVTASPTGLLTDWASAGSASTSGSLEDDQGCVQFHGYAIIERDLHSAPPQRPLAQAPEGSVAAYLGPLHQHTSMKEEQSTHHLMLIRNAISASCDKRRDWKTSSSNNHEKTNDNNRPLLAFTALDFGELASAKA